MPESAAVALFQTASPDAPQAHGADRFVGFAFAAADLLVETDVDGTIGFATGAFRTRLGCNAAHYFGRPIASLFVPDDAATLEMAIATARTRGRIPPLVLRLADQSASPTSVAALLMPPTGPQRPPRLCFSIGPVPCQKIDPKQSSALRDKSAFITLAEEAVRSGHSAGISLVDVAGLRPASHPQSADEQRQLHEKLRQVLEEAAPGASPGELGHGRFGLISQAEMDIDDVVARLEHLLTDGAASTSRKISGLSMKLDGTGLPPAQAARALRYALGRFAQGQGKAHEALGGKNGLAGIVATAQARAHNLRRTLADRRFRLLYQPVVGLSDRAIHHFEALIRPIPVPGEPPQSIEEFVTFAEMVGLSEQLDWAVLQMALQALREAPGASVAVNMSGLSMQSPDYRDRLVTHLRTLRPLLGPPGTGRLLIELTETAEIDDLPGAAAAMTALREEGIPMCLDDFGAGAAAFRYLRAFPIDFVKIDGAFVRAAVNHARERAMVVAMIEIATAVGAQIVAETIETEEQAHLMASLGVQYGQGWLFGRPGHLPGTR